MCEALRITILVRGNADSFDSTGLTEEVKQTVLLGMEAQVADKQSRRFA